MRIKSAQETRTHPEGAARSHLQDGWQVNQHGGGVEPLLRNRGFTSDAEGTEDTGDNRKKRHQAYVEPRTVRGFTPQGEESEVEDILEDNIIWSYEHATRCIRYYKSEDPKAAIDEYDERQRLSRKERDEPVKPVIMTGSTHATEEFEVANNIIWSYQRAMQCIAFAESDDPGEAIDAYREQTREAMQKHRNIEEPLSRDRGSTYPGGESEVEDILEEAKQQSLSGSDKRIMRAVQAFLDCREDEREREKQQSGHVEPLRPLRGSTPQNEGSEVGGILVPETRTRPGVVDPGRLEGGVHVRQPGGGVEPLPRGRGFTDGGVKSAGIPAGSTREDEESEVEGGAQA